MSSNEEGTGDGESGAPSKDKKESPGGAKRFQPRNGFQRPAVALRQAKFEGKCDALKGHIYDYSDARQADLFTKTTKEIAEFVGRTYKYGSDTRLAVEGLALPTLTMPTDPDASASKTELKIWDENVKEFVKRSNYLSENVKTLYSLVWGQCTDIMRQKIEALDNFSTMSLSSDGLGLL